MSGTAQQQPDAVGTRVRVQLLGAVSAVAGDAMNSKGVVVTAAARQRLVNGGGSDAIKSQPIAAPSLRGDFSHLPRCKKFWDGGERRLKTPMRSTGASGW